MASSSFPDVVEFALALLASGALAGLLAGLFGISGGLVIVPVLHPLLTTLGMHNSIVVHMAAAVSIGLVILMIGRALLQRHNGRLVGPGQPQAWLWPIPAGAVAASVVVATLPGPEMQLVFTIAILAAAVKMLFFAGSAGMTVTNGGPAEVAFKLPDARAGLDWKTDIDRAIRAIQRLAGSPAATCALLAIPGIIVLAMAGFGEPRLPAGIIGYLNALGVVVILVTSTLLAPVGAELSGQFPKRVLEVSFGIFLLLVAAEFAFELLG